MEAALFFGDVAAYQQRCPQLRVCAATMSGVTAFELVIVEAPTTLEDAFVTQLVAALAERVVVLLIGPVPLQALALAKRSLRPTQTLCEAEVLSWRQHTTFLGVWPCAVDHAQAALASAVFALPGRVHLCESLVAAALMRGDPFVLGKTLLSDASVARVLDTLDTERVALRQSLGYGCGPPLVRAGHGKAGPGPASNRAACLALLCALDGDANACPVSRSLLQLQSCIEGVHASASMTAALCGFADAKQLLAFVNARDKRYLVVKEIAKTEQSYVAGLRTLTQLPRVANIEERVWSDVMFPRQLTVLIGIHERFLERLQPLIDCWSPLICVADLMRELCVQCTHLYATYAAHFADQVEVVRSHSASNPLFQQLLQQINLDRADLVSLLISPVKKVPRELLLIKELIKQTSATHPDRAQLLMCQKLYEDACATIERATDAVENMRRVKELQQRYRLDAATVAHARVVLLECKVVVSRVGECVALVFNDALVLVLPELQSMPPLRIEFVNAAKTVTEGAGGAFKIGDVLIKSSTNAELRRICDERIVAEKEAEAALRASTAAMVVPVERSGSARAQNSRVASRVTNNDDTDAEDDEEEDDGNH